MIARTDSGLHLDASRGFYLETGAPGLARRVRGLGHRGARFAGLARVRMVSRHAAESPGCGSKGRALKGHGFARMLRVTEHARCARIDAGARGTLGKDCWTLGIVWACMGLRMLPMGAHEQTRAGARERKARMVRA